MVHKCHRESIACRHVVSSSVRVCSDLRVFETIKSATHIASLEYANGLSFIASFCVGFHVLPKRRD